MRGARIDPFSNTKCSHRFGMQGAVSPLKPNEACHRDFRWHGQARDAWGVLDPLVPAEGTSGTGMGWVGKGGALPLPAGAVFTCHRGGSLLLAAVPSSAIAPCLPLPPRGAGGAA